MPAGQPKKENEIHKKILMICGSTRLRSVNSQILDAIATLYKDHADFDRYDAIGGLPHFNPDLTKEPLPPAVADFHHRIAAADAVMICTPEYVFSLPGSFKNALEWTVSTTLFTGKPGALITAASSGHKAHEALQLVMGTIGLTWGSRGALLISAPKTKINDKGEITDPVTLHSIKALMEELLVISY